MFDMPKNNDTALRLYQQLSPDEQDELSYDETLQEVFHEIAEEVMTRTISLEEGLDELHERLRS
jgi:hypothetical protein